MPSDPRSNPRSTETVPLRVRHAGPIDLSRAVVAFRDPSWLGPLVDQDQDERGLRRVVSDLELPILDGSRASPIRKSAYIDVGEPLWTKGSVDVEISWRSATFAPLFPVFAGRVDIGPDEIVIQGRYAPPFGQLGLVLDRGLLHLVARRTAGALLARLVRQITA